MHSVDQAKNRAVPIPPPLSLYIHLPWCVQKCPYCDFNSHGRRSGIPETAYTEALLNDLRQELQSDSLQGRTISSIFMGGGTPSLFSPSAIACLLDDINQLLPVDRDCEITMEANPGTTDQQHFRGYRQAGINRLSLGIQSLDDACLARLGRIHNSAQALSAFEQARRAGFDNINLDLMFGLPGQSHEAMLLDVTQVLAMHPEHLSYYQLTLEPGTRFFDRPPELPDADGLWDSQQQAQQRIAEAGLGQYEISAYSRPGRQCRHNRNYWLFGDYIGIGAGAHGKISMADGQIMRVAKQADPAEYMQNADSSGRIALQSVISWRDLPLEFMMNALRLREGFPVKLFLQRTGLADSDLQPGLEQCLTRGLLEYSDDCIRCTPLGWQHLNDAVEFFMPDY